MKQLEITEQYSELLQIDLLEVFNKFRNKSVNASYSDREDRNRFAAEYIINYQFDNILNVGGGGQRHLEKQISNLGSKKKIFEIDMEGEADLTLNMDKIDKLPFSNEAFDICCAFDVLEHLENFHLVNNELFRVSKNFVLISLPNSAFEIFPNVFKNNPQQRPDMNRGTYSKYYGIPLQIPNDRHRWWLYFFDIIRFYYWFSLNNKCNIEFFIPNNKGSYIMQALETLNPFLYHTFFVPHVWIKLIKNN